MRVRGLWAVVAAGAVLLGGCADPQEANDTLPTATSSSAGASATLEPLGPADFPVPDEAREQTAAGSTAMATYYLTLVDRISGQLSTPSFDSGPIRDLSSGCEYCETLADSLNNIHNRGERFVGGEWTFPGINSQLDDETHANAVILIQEAASRTLNSQGVEIPGSSYPAAQLSGGLVLEWNEARTAWLISQFDLARV